MSMSDFLYPILVMGAKLLAKPAVGGFAKSAGSSAFELLKDTLINKYSLGSVHLLNQVEEKPQYALIIKDDLNCSDLVNDQEIKDWSQIIINEIDLLPKSDRPASIDVGTIKALGNQIFEDVEGISAKLIEAEGDQTFKGIRSPGKS